MLRLDFFGRLGSRRGYLFLAGEQPERGFNPSLVESFFSGLSAVSTAYEIVRRDWSSDVCSSDLPSIELGLKLLLS